MGVNRTQRRRGLALIAGERKRLLTQFGLSEGFLEEALETSTRGFGTSQKAIEQLSGNRRGRQVQESASQLQGELLGLAQTGRAGTSLAGVSASSAAGRLARDLSAIDTQANSAIAGLRAGQAQQEGLGRSRIAALRQQQAKSEIEQLFDPTFNLFTSRGKGPTVVGDILGVVGGVLGGIYGGFGGGVTGAQLGQKLGNNFGS